MKFVNMKMRNVALIILLAWAPWIVGWADGSNPTYDSITVTGAITCATLEASTSAATPKLISYGAADLLLVPPASGYGVSICDYASVARMHVETNGDPGDGDVIVTMTNGDGGTQVLTVDDGLTRVKVSGYFEAGTVRSLSNLLCAANIAAEGYIRSDVGFYGTSASAPALFPKNLILSEQAAPGDTAANTGVLYLDSTSNNFMTKFDSGAAVDTAIHP